MTGKPTLPVVYESNSREQPVAPFIIAPTLHEQTSLVLAPRSLAPFEGQFLNQIFQNQPTADTFPIIKIFPFRGIYIIAVSFASTVQEKGSGRGGLFFTLGLSLSPGFARNGSFPAPGSYMKLFISLFHSIQVDLYQGGADTLVSRLQNLENYGALAKTFSKFADVMEQSADGRDNRDSFIDRALQMLPILGPKRRLPRLVLCLEDMDVRDFVDLSLYQIDTYFRSTHHITDATITDDPAFEGHSTVFMRLSLSDDEARTVRYERVRNKSVIYIE